MYRFILLGILFLFSVQSKASITLSVKVTPTGSEDVEEAMDCEMTLYRGRQNPLATLEGIDSNLVAANTHIKGYRLNEKKENVFVDTHKFSEIPLDFDHFAKQLAVLAGTSLKGNLNSGGPVGPRVTYSGNIDGKKFVLRDTSERGEVYNPHENEDMLRDIVLQACYGRL